MMTLEEQATLSRKAARALIHAPREDSAKIRDQVRDEVNALAQDGTPLSREVERFLDRYGTEKPVAAPPLTGLEVDELLTEVVMGTAAKDSKVRDTPETRKLRKVLRKQVREMKAKGITPMAPN